ncbi:calcium/sodium antiporter [Cyanobium sp. NIES-981]|uniref:calcium/sodium antiporter n=1 Tax=Cyanobium sp. NIES-981 TaxID=1851505 RepID=UPI0007DD6724|nr:calcium/sodium antiporter [Cyanobium sp. NIES-981]SBO41862.1 putative K+-dependent Na+/Ca+ exchanger [Cyanobium sp. NIES-981]
MATLAPSAIQIVLGIALLFGGGELFVAGSTAVALLLGIPQLVIGLTVVSLGTSAPELFVSLISTLQGNDAIALSNVVGSNIFNVLVVLGMSALVVPLSVRSRIVRRDVPLLLAVSMAVWGMASGSRLTWQAGLALLVGLVINLVWEIRTAGENPDETDELNDEERLSPPAATVRLLGGLVLLVLGSQLLVRGATTAALALGVSQTVVGLTIVAAGTSMPELVTSLVAAYRGRMDLAIGNVVGSNLLNLFVILGLCALASGSRGLEVDPTLVSRDLPVMLATTMACLPIFWSHGQITRLEGGLLVLLYGLYLLEQVLTNTLPTVTDGFRLVTLTAVLPLVLLVLVWQSVRWWQERRS